VARVAAGLAAQWFGILWGSSVAKIRESGIPPLELWESFFDTEVALDALGYQRVNGDAVEFGCGYGTFTLPAARRTSGMVYALDIDSSMVAVTAERAARTALRNVVAEERDFLVVGCGRQAGSMCYAMLFNILHLEDPVILLKEAYRVLRPTGIAGVMHWKRDARTPRGPPLEIRPSPQQCQLWGEAAGFQMVGTPELPGCPWHWGLVLSKPASN
jgi:SAM-dependent methyltransferase